ncbi:MAG: pur operon repressor [Christensenellales bacterium]|jgi:purine operon repressor
MEKVKRNERLSVITHVLTNSPNKIYTLSHFCNMFRAAKSTISEDIDLIRGYFANYSLGEIETVTGVSGGVRYLPYPVGDGYELVSSICKKLSEPSRVLPGGYLYTNDILTNPALVDKLGRMLASQFARHEPDFVLTAEMKGVPLAMATAKALGIHCVVCRRNSDRFLDWPSVSINYMTGSGVRPQTMSLAKKLVKEGQRTVIIDAFIRGGGTARGMMEMMREFAITVVGIGMLITRETDTKKRVDGVKSLMVLKDLDEDSGAVIEPAPWISGR